MIYHLIKFQIYSTSWTIPTINVYLYCFYSRFVVCPRCLQLRYYRSWGFQCSQRLHHVHRRSETAAEDVRCTRPFSQLHLITHRLRISTVRLHLSGCISKRRYRWEKAVYVDLTVCVFYYYENWLPYINIVY